MVSDWEKMAHVSPMSPKVTVFLVLKDSTVQMTQIHDPVKLFLVQKASIVV